MKKLKTFFESLCDKYHKWRFNRRYKKKLAEMRKRDPYTYD